MFCLVFADPACLVRPVFLLAWYCVLLGFGWAACLAWSAWFASSARSIALSCSVLSGPALPGLCERSVFCQGVVHKEEGVQVRVQVEVGREEAGEGETRGNSQNEATRNKLSIAHHGWHEYGVSRACRHLSHAV